MDQLLSRELLILLDRDLSYHETFYIEAAPRHVEAVSALLFLSGETDLEISLLIFDLNIDYGGVPKPVLYYTRFQTYFENRPFTLLVLTDVTGESWYPVICLVCAERNNDVRTPNHPRKALDFIHCHTCKNC